MIKACVMGAAGYAGEELTRILAGHPDVSIEYLSSKSHASKKMSDIYPSFSGSGLILEDINMEKALGCDVVFTALPHGISGK